MAFALFETALGPTGLEWSETGIRRLSFARTPEALRELFPAHEQALKRPPFVREAINQLREHLSGSPRDLSLIGVDFGKASPTFRGLAAALRATPAGALVDGNALATRLALPGGLAQLRRLLSRNPLPVLLPGHRVLGRDGLLGAWGGGEAVHERLLGLETMAHPPLYGANGAPEPARLQAALAQLRANDPTLGALMERVGPYQLTQRQGISPYEALARSIVGQQITGRAAKAILGHLATEFGTRGVPRPERILAAKEAKLRAAGLSGAKARAFRDLAERTLAGGVPSWSVLRRWPDERILATLTEIHGIGRWTVEMVLLFRLGRPDVLPLGDYGVRKGFGRAFNDGRLPSVRELQRRGWRWRPFRSVASWYLWRALELP